MNIVSKMSQQTIVDAPKIASVMKNKKGNNFVIEEERQFCCNFFHVSQDPTTCIDLRSIAFWDQIHEHYNQINTLVE
jgi:uncharacterized protein YjiK